MIPPSAVYTRVTRMGVWKCSFPAHLWGIYFKWLPGTMLGATDSHKQSARHCWAQKHNRSSRSPLAWQTPQQWKTDSRKRPPGRHSQDVPGETTPERWFHLMGKVTIPKQIASKAQSIPTVTYWHLEQMVTLSENLFSKLGEGVHEMLEIPAKLLGCKLWSDSELTR